MEYISPCGVEAQDPLFAARVKELSGVNIDRCYQCLTCTLGCPVSFAMDYWPNQILRMTQLGLKAQVLQSSAIWICASCECCATRCPNEIDLPRVTDTLRQIASREKISGKVDTIPLFHQIFLKGIWRWGRQYDLGLVLEFKLKARDIFSDIGLGINMLRRGKLALLPAWVKRAMKMESFIEVRGIFRRWESKF